MRKIILITTVLLQSALFSLAAGDYYNQWKKATDLYTQKQYDSAAYYFEQIAALKPLNAEVYYNLGNSYYRLNIIGLAILNFERALRINPEYVEAKDNLILAQSRISNHIPYAKDIFFINWWQSLTRADKSTAWAVAALITFTLIIILLLIRFFQKTWNKIPIQAPGILGFIFICLLSLAYIAGKNMEEHTNAVVMQNDAPLMNNEQKGKPLVLIPEGTTVKIKGERGVWIEVTLPDGRNGWLQQNLVTKI